MAEKTLAALFLKRWWDLRDQVSPSQLLLLLLSLLLPSAAFVCCAGSALGAGPQENPSTALP